MGLYHIRFISISAMVSELGPRNCPRIQNQRSFQNQRSRFIWICDATHERELWPFILNSGRVSWSKFWDRRVLLYCPGDTKDGSTLSKSMSMSYTFPSIYVCVLALVMKFCSCLSYYDSMEHQWRQTRTTSVTFFCNFLFFILPLICFRNCDEYWCLTAMLYLVNS